MLAAGKMHAVRVKGSVPEPSRLLPEAMTEFAAERGGAPKPDGVTIRFADE